MHEETYVPRRPVETLKLPRYNCDVPGSKLCQNTGHHYIGFGAPQFFQRSARIVTSN
jgi:hypothetical protein